MNRGEIIELLLHDMRDEHAAIIQYLTHAYAIGECEIACEIGAITRDEMRHLNWLAVAIVQLGGQPTLDRGQMRTAGDTVPTWLQNDVLQEKDAINHYRDHIAQIDDPKIKRLLEHILADEMSHQEKFRDFIDESEDEGLE
ncbi:MAG: ferritin-like domain-containing protein [Rhodospirillales bacterium]|jgi:bacterioferritin|nr:ferritin-like domain-containing protein [Rhodospirillales bacterium]